MSDHWINATDHFGRRDTAEDEAGYVTGWTISGLATLGVIVAVWIFAI